MNKGMELAMKVGVLAGKTLAIGATTIVIGFLTKKSRDEGGSIAREIEDGIKYFIENRKN